MCGIAGIISLNKNEVTHQRLKAMTDIIAYRGQMDYEKRF
jgi:asparagine synthetase B (glutamine-hydrolysing)